VGPPAPPTTRLSTMDRGCGDPVSSENARESWLLRTGLSLTVWSLALVATVLAASGPGRVRPLGRHHRHPSLRRTGRARTGPPSPSSSSATAEPAAATPPWDYGSSAAAVGGFAVYNQRRAHRRPRRPGLRRRLRHPPSSSGSSSCAMTTGSSNDRPGRPPGPEPKTRSPVARRAAAVPPGPGSSPPAAVSPLWTKPWAMPRVWRAVYEDARTAKVGRRLARRTAWRSVAESRRRRLDRPPPHRRNRRRPRPSKRTQEKPVAGHRGGGHRRP